MSALSSFIPSRFLPAAISARDRGNDPLSHLRFVLETMPGARKYLFTPAIRAEILSELYEAFWGSYSHLFLPNSNAALPRHVTLSHVQASRAFCGAGKPPPVIPGRPCSHILKKGESCFRCRSAVSLFLLMRL
jgi:E3 ubiquitin-protein ligase UBR1